MENKNCKLIAVRKKNNYEDKYLIETDGNINFGVAKSGNNYNHKLLWDHVKPKKCNKPYYYYPRGRLEFSNKGKPLLYMNINIGEEFIPIIMAQFGLNDKPIIHYDGSKHYKCYLD